MSRKASNIPTRRADAKRRRRPSWRASPRRSPSTTGATTRTTRRPISDADYDALRAAQQPRSKRAFPDLVRAEIPSRAGRRAAGARLRQGAARGADAVARQCLRRGGGRAISPRASAASWSSMPRRAARLHRRAEDRRPVAVAALRGRRSWSARRNARRRHRGRGRDRQCAGRWRTCRSARAARTCPTSARSAARST